MGATAATLPPAQPSTHRPPRARPGAGSPRSLMSRDEAEGPAPLVAMCVAAPAAARVPAPNARPPPLRPRLSPEEDRVFSFPPTIRGSRVRVPPAAWHVVSPAFASPFLPTSPASAYSGWSTDRSTRSFPSLTSRRSSGRVYGWRSRSVVLLLRASQPCASPPVTRRLPSSTMRTCQTWPLSSPPPSRRLRVRPPRGPKSRPAACAPAPLTPAPPPPHRRLITRHERNVQPSGPHPPGATDPQGRGSDGAALTHALPCPQIVLRPFQRQRVVAVITAPANGDGGGAEWRDPSEPSAAVPPAVVQCPVRLLSTPLSDPHSTAGAFVRGAAREAGRLLPSLTASPCTLRRWGSASRPNAPSASTPSCAAL